MRPGINAFQAFTQKPHRIPIHKNDREVHEKLNSRKRAPVISKWCFDQATDGSAVAGDTQWSCGRLPEEFPSSSPTHIRKTGRKTRRGMASAAGAPSTWTA